MNHWDAIYNFGLDNYGIEWANALIEKIAMAS